MYFQQYFPSFPAKFLTFVPLLQKATLSKKPNKQIGQEAESWKNRTGGVIIPEKTQWHSVMTLCGCQHPLNVSRIMVSPTRGLAPNATPYLSYFRPHLLRGATAHGLALREGGRSARGQLQARPSASPPRLCTLR